MDPSLTLASASAHTHHHDDHNPAYLDPALAQEDIDAATAEIINASIRTAAQAHAAAAAEAEAEAEAVAAEAVVSGTEAENADLENLEYPLENPTAGPSTRPAVLRNVVTPSNSASLYPYAPPQRDEFTPHPLEQSFASRAEFDVWLAAESSWCHYVQRRVTNPEKRAEERAKARDKAHEKKLAEMDPEEAAREPPLKKRHRTRTSAVVHKITYTCHHAGKYQSQHNTDLPQERLRMNTKTSVKCGCLSRVVMNEMEDGEIKVAYWWKHNGHDPFAEKEAETYRLPQSVTDWLLAQFQKGKEPEDIIKLLNIPEEEKLERIRRAAAAAASTSTPTITAPNPDASDPDALTSAIHGSSTESLLPVEEDEDLPPIVAYGLQIKYPDLYNRYRKVGPPLRAKKGDGGEAVHLKPRAPAAPAKRGRKRKGDTAEAGDSAEAGSSAAGAVEKVQAKVGVRSSKRQKGKGKVLVVEEEEEETPTAEVGVEGGAAGAVQEGPTEVTPPPLVSDQHAQLYLHDDDFTFGDLHGQLHDLHDPEPEPSTSTSDAHAAVPSLSVPAGGEGDVDMGPTAEEESHVDMIRAAVIANRAGADAAGEAGTGDSGAELGVGGIDGVEGADGDAGDGEAIDEDDEANRMTEELEKLANEITSTWRH